MANLAEHRLQSLCYVWFHNTYARERGRLFAVNNNSSGSRAGAINKALGVVAGVADMVFLGAKKTIFIEFKTLKGRQSELQQRFQEFVASSNTRDYVLIRNFDHFLEIIKANL